MPAIYAHNRFGEAVVATLPPTFQKYLAQYNEAFCLGTQGPDILFYHQPLKSNPIKKRGMDLHLASAESFFVRQGTRLWTEKLVKIQDGEILSDSPDAAYIAGFICHFTLDAHAHPDIYKLEDTGISHGRIESEFDKYLLRKDGRPVRGYHTGQQITPTNGAAEACAEALDVTVEEATLSIKTMKRINGWFTSTCAPFHGLVHAVLTVAGMERKFGDMFLHKKDEPHCTEWNPVFEKDFNVAVPKAAALIEEYFSTLPQIVESGKMNEFFRNNYTGGNI